MEVNQHMMIEELPCLPLIVERHINKVRSIGNEYKNPDLEVQVFTQVWGSTALGFSGFGGQAITKAYTTVVLDDNELFYSVFFGNRLAYTIKDPSAQFFADLHAQKMKAVSESRAYIRKNN